MRPGEHREPQVLSLLAERDRLRGVLEGIKDMAYVNQGGRVSWDWLYATASAALGPDAEGGGRGD